MLKIIYEGKASIEAPSDGEVEDFICTLLATRLSSNIEFLTKVNKLSFGLISKQ